MHKKIKRERSFTYKSGNMSPTNFHVQIPSVHRVVCAFSTRTCPRRTPQGWALTGHPADKHDTRTRKDSLGCSLPFNTFSGGDGVAKGYD